MVSSVVIAEAHTVFVSQAYKTCANCKAHNCLITLRSKDSTSYCKYDLTYYTPKDQFTVENAVLFMEDDMVSSIYIKPNKLDQTKTAGKRIDSSFREFQFSQFSEDGQQDFNAWNAFININAKQSQEAIEDSNLKHAADIFIIKLLVIILLLWTCWSMIESNWNKLQRNSRSRKHGYFPTQCKKNERKYANNANNANNSNHVNANITNNAKEETVPKHNRKNESIIEHKNSAETAPRMPDDSLRDSTTNTQWTYVASKRNFSDC